MDEIAIIPVRPPRPLSEIRAELRLARESTLSSITVLREQVTVRTDWHTYVRERPWFFVGAAFFFGFALATASSIRRQAPSTRSSHVR